MHLQNIKRPVVAIRSRVKVYRFCSHNDQAILASIPMRVVPSRFTPALHATKNVTSFYLTTRTKCKLYVRQAPPIWRVKGVGETAPRDETLLKWSFDAGHNGLLVKKFFGRRSQFWASKRQAFILGKGCGRLCEPRLDVSQDWGEVNLFNVHKEVVGSPSCWSS